MEKTHIYQATVQWTGNKGEGTTSYSAYDRSHTISVQNKHDIIGSADPAFRGDISKYNPEEFLVASLSSCHMLWFLHLCATNKVVVTNYVDHPEGTMLETESGAGYFVRVVLKPEVTVKEEAMIDKLKALHKEANQLCFIANSVNFPVIHHASSRVEAKQT
ncbi:MAG: OsmC family protein [Bacteroidota bacterium]